METVSRNDPCPCGSGKKYKNCHLGKSLETRSRRFLVPLVLAFGGAAIGVYLAIVKSVTLGLSVGAGALIVVGLFVLLRDPPPPGHGGDPGAINFGK
ncbi:MAG: SEC-C domain-containing protein [Proteobacteria bacterium]|nr:SEC-C domain-containing protein [Pseudomonadota bacterium]